MNSIDLVISIKRMIEEEAKKKALRNGEGAAQGNVFLYGKNAGEVRGLQEALRIIEQVIKAANKDYLSK